MLKFPGGKPTEAPKYTATSGNVEDGVYALTVKSAELLPKEKLGKATMAITITFKQTEQIPFEAKTTVFFRAPANLEDGRKSKGNLFILNEMLTALDVPVKSDGEFSLTNFKGKQAHVYLYKGAAGFTEVFERFFPIAIEGMDTQEIKNNLTALFQQAVNTDRVKVFDPMKGAMPNARTPRIGGVAGGVVKPVIEEDDDDDMPF